MISNIRLRKKHNEIRWKKWDKPTFSLENNPILSTLDLFVPHYFDVAVHEPAAGKNRIPDMRMKKMKRKYIDQLEFGFKVTQMTGEEEGLQY